MEPTSTFKPDNFWRRQWAEEPTRAQTMFDFAFGVAAPILCVVFDPGVFRNTDPCLLLLSCLAPFAYAAIGLGVCLLALWLVWGRRLPRGASVLAGVFFAGEFFAAGVGLFTAPLGLLSLATGTVVGVFGVTPLITAWVFQRNARRAWRWARERGEARSGFWRWMLAAAGVVLALGLPTAAFFVLPAAPPPAGRCASE